MATIASETSVSIGKSIVDTFVEGMSSIASGAADTVKTVFNTLVVTENGGLSNLAIWGLVFGGIALALGFVRMFTRKLG